MSNAKGFVIKNGILREYKGTGGDVVIPEGVKTIGDYAFKNCSSLTSITIPEGVKTIGDYAFKNCSSLTSITIPEGVKTIGDYAFANCSSLTSITIPEGVKTIGDCAFANCSSLTSITIPEGVTAIGWDAFYNCSSLTSITIPDSVTSIEASAFSGCDNIQKFKPISPLCKTDTYAFGNSYPQIFLEDAGTYWACFTDYYLKKYVLNKQVWDKITPETRKEIFLTRQGKTFFDVYRSLIEEEEAKLIGKALLNVLSGSPNAKDFTAAANFVTLCFKVTDTDLLKAIYAKLKEFKEAKKAIKTIEAHGPLMEKLGANISVDDSLPEVEKKIMKVLLDRQEGVKDFERSFKMFYSLSFSELPTLLDTSGAKVSPVVLAYLFMLHEKQIEYTYKNPEVVVAYEQPGICPEAQELVAMIDDNSLQQALLTLADKYLGISGKSKKMFLAYPICRYADDKTMTTITRKAPKWRSYSYGDDSPPLVTFRLANTYSETLAAMIFADKYHELDYYAGIRGMTEDSLRDRYLSDVGVDKNGCKNYDLGNQTVSVVLQSDFSFSIKLSNGKSAKSLPKRGADKGKYEAAADDFSWMKKAVKRIAKNRYDVLFEDYLSSRARTASEWEDAYLINPVLRMVASLLVWAQEDKTFTLGKNGTIIADGTPYTITDKPIKVAHPIEMKEDDIIAWQKYFSANSLKQPFEQVWEPVFDAQSVSADRYKDCDIPYYRFHGQNKRGITIEDKNFHDDIYISIDDCLTDIKRLDFESHVINMTDRFVIQNFKFKKYTRKVNHIVAYLDRVTIYDRVKKDDISIASLLKHFTLAQITEFIKIAQENNCFNVTAVLLEYKNANFADFDPIAEFTLDF